MPLFRGDRYFRDLIGGKTLTLLSGSRSFRGGGGDYFRNSTVTDSFGRFLKQRSTTIEFEIFSNSIPVETNIKFPLLYGLCL